MQNAANDVALDKVSNMQHLVSQLEGVEGILNKLKIDIEKYNPNKPDDKQLN